ncbi:MAG: LacI family DNA-binding transcriptional regulator [Chloroflexota bacterium]
MTTSLQGKRPTIRDIAKLAGVSHQTVSRALNNQARIAPETRKRILRIARDLGYHPNRAAKMLSMKRSFVLEVNLVNIEPATAFSLSAKIMSDTAKDLGYSVMFAEITPDEINKAIESAASRLVDGMALYAPRLNDDREIAEIGHRHNIPIVRRDYAPDSKLACVGYDIVYGATLAVQHLLDQGHRHVAEISGPLEYTAAAIRHNTWQKLLEDNGIEPGPSVAGDYSIKSGYEAMLELLKHKIPFTALVAGNDHMALGAIRALQEHGRSIPDDVSVVGFDDKQYAAYIDPPLTTIRQSFDRQDKIVTEYLIELIENTDTEIYHRVLQPELVVRNSVRNLNA